MLLDAGGLVLNGHGCPAQAQGVSDFKPAGMERGLVVEPGALGVATVGEFGFAQDLLVLKPELVGVGGGLLECPDFQPALALHGVHRSWHDWSIPVGN